MFKSNTKEEIQRAVIDGLTIYSLSINGEIDDLLTGEDLPSVVQDVLTLFEIDELPENMTVNEYRGIF